MTLNGSESKVKKKESQNCSGRKEPLQNIKSDPSTYEHKMPNAKDPDILYSHLYMD